MLTCINDFSTFAKVYFLRTKSEVTTKFIEYKAEMEPQCGTTIKAIRTDNGGEFKNKRFEILPDK